jgi:hypothetical protein
LNVTTTQNVTSQSLGCAADDHQNALRYTTYCCQ